MINVNIMGTFNTVFPVLKRFIYRKHGHIAFNCSLAAYYPLFGSTSAYSACKVFVKFMCQTLSVSLMYYGIDCTHIEMGWIDTEMIMDGTRKYSKNVNDAAAVIVNGLYRNKASIHYPFYFSFLMWYFGGMHPVLQQCFSWMAMPGPNEPNFVFLKYLKQQQRSIQNEKEEESEQKDDEEAVQF